MNNRIIKFKVWDTKEKKFITETPQVEFIHHEKSWGNEFHLEISQEEYDPTRYIFLQFTGLKDKNGTPIYEGDIVENGDYEIDAHAWNTWKEVVEWCEGDAGFIGTYPSEDGMKCEVIGNIFENPTLLQEKGE